MKRIDPSGRDSLHCSIKTKLNKLATYGLIKIKDNAHTFFCLIEDYVKFSDIKFPNRKSLAVSLFMNGKWSIYEI